MAPIAYVVIAAAKYAWAIKLGLFLISVVIYYFINERKREKLAESLELDPRIGAPFSGASHVFKERETTSRWLSAWLWLGIIASVVGLVMGFVVDGGHPAWLLLWVFGLGLAFYDYFAGIGREESSPIASIAFHPDHLILVDREGLREVFVFGPGVSFTVEMREITEGTTFGADKLKGWECFMTVSDGRREKEIPLAFPGAGEFLARCRHEGSPVRFSPGSADWLVDKLKALPSWQPGYFDKPSAATAAHVEMSCQGCGGAAHYAPSTVPPACQYCGSPKLLRK